MDSDDAKEMLAEIEKQGDVRVARLLRLHWDEENDNTFMWSINGCAQCGAPGEEFVAGAEGFVWGKPCNNDPDCQYAVLEVFCSEQCSEQAVAAWAEELSCDVYAAWHTF